MTDRLLEVHLDGHPVGRLTQTGAGNLTFEYEVDYRARPDATPLSLSMPLTTAVPRKRAVLPWLQGLLPDNDEALSAIGRRYGASPRSPFALLEHVGTDAAGAVQIASPGLLASDAGSRGNLRRVSDDQVEGMLTRVVAEYTEGAPMPTPRTTR